MTKIAKPQQSMNSIWLLDILMFLLLFAYVAGNQWQAADLVWGFWLSSLVFGFVFLLIPYINIVSSGEKTIFFRTHNRLLNALLEALINLALVLVAFAFLGFSAISVAFLLLLILSWLLRMDEKKRKKWGVAFLPKADSLAARLITPIPGLLIVLVLFSAVFLLLHMVEGYGIHVIFPLVEGTFTFNDFSKLHQRFFGLVREAFASGWLIVLVSGLSRLDYYISAVQTRGLTLLYKPYRYIFRMQVSMLLFIILHLVGVRGFALYPVLIVYFLPYEQIYCILTKE